MMLEILYHIKTFRWKQEIRSLTEQMLMLKLEVKPLTRTEINLAHHFDHIFSRRVGKGKRLNYTRRTLIIFPLL